MPYTPGPWTAFISGDGRWFVREVRKIGNIIARLWADPQSEANAKLIAAAPDMLIALRRASDALLECSHLAQASGGDWTEGSEKAFCAVEAAIAKATNSGSKGGNHVS